MWTEMTGSAVTVFERNNWKHDTILFPCQKYNVLCYTHDELEDTATYVEREDFLETWENLISMVQSDAGPIPTSFSARIRNL